MAAVPIVYLDRSILHGCGISITCVRCWTLLLPWRARTRMDTLSIVRVADVTGLAPADRRARHLYCADLAVAAPKFSESAGLFHRIAAHSARCDAQCCSGLSAADCQLWPVLCLGSKRRSLARNHGRGLLWIRSVYDLRPAPTAACLPGCCIERRRLRDPARAHRQVAWQRWSREAAHS
jgi:hypothetical protein